MEEKQIKRSGLATFLKAPTKFHRMGKGISEQSIAYNANTSSDQFIDEDSASPSVNSYAPTMNTPQTCFKGEPVFEFVNNIRFKRLTGTDCETEFLEADIFDEVSDGVYKAQTCNCAIQIEEIGGPATDPLSITYSVLLKGDPVFGTATIENKVATFTETALD